MLRLAETNLRDEAEALGLIAWMQGRDAEEAAGDGILALMETATHEHGPPAHE